MNNGGITGKGKAWEVSKIWWLIVLAVFYLGWISFVYMGQTTKNKKWLVEGIVYCVILHLGFLFSSVPLFIVLMMLGWVISILRLNMIKKEYLLRRAAVDGMSNIKDEELRMKIQSEYNGPLAEATERVAKSLENRTSVVNQAPVSQPPLQNTERVVNNTPIVPKPQEKASQSQNTFTSAASTNGFTGEIIDINTCGEDALASLPGVSVAMAKKAISHREEIGGFENLDSFYQFLELKPHIISQISEQIKCSAPEGNAARQTGRILDI